MQLMPQTASILGVRNSFDPRENIDGGVRHLRAMIDRFPHSLALAIAAYNAGERAVAQYGTIPPYPETQDYVAKVMRFYGGIEGGTTPPTRIYQTVGATARSPTRTSRLAAGLDTWGAPKWPPHPRVGTPRRTWPPGNALGWET